ncbi:MAG TPA: small basic family protein [Desulfobacteria bacterium]|nr:small basic family protein [Desulfobacteria bacterium]
MWLPLLALFLGFLVGQTFTFTLPAEFAPYLSVAILATLDSTLGGVRGVMQGKYDAAILMTGFFINGSLSAFMVLTGDWIGVDLYYVAIFVFGLRIFQNLAIIRREFIDRYLPLNTKKSHSASQEVQ